MAAGPQHIPYVPGIAVATSTPLHFTAISIPPATAVSLIPQIVWTVVPAKDPLDRDVFVSNSTGSDAQLFGFVYGDLTVQGSAQRPFLTLAAAYVAMRDGFGDRMWLKKGDTWTSESLGTWGKSGVTSARPMIVGAYGSGARPLIKTGLASIVVCGTASNIHDVWFMDFEAYPHLYNGSTNYTSGVSWQCGASGSNNILFENLSIHDYGKMNFLINSLTATPSINTTLRGCNVYRANCNFGGTFAFNFDAMWTVEGIYAYGCQGLTIDFCMFDENGWIVPTEQHALRRNMYIDNVNTGVVITNCWLLRTEGIQLRCGGTFVNCALSNGCSPIYLGDGSSPNVGGVNVICEDNVALATQDPQAGWLGLINVNWAMTVSNVSSGSIRRNICANSSNANDAVGLGFDSSHPVYPYICANVEVEDNIFHDCGGWSLYFYPNAGSPFWTSNGFRRNIFQNPNNHNYSTYYHTHSPSSQALVYLGDMTIGHAEFDMQENKYWPGAGSLDVQINPGPQSELLATYWSQFADAGSTKVLTTFVDSTRSVPSYSTAIGGPATLTLFCDVLRAMSKDNWDMRYTAPSFNAYARTGFTPV